MTELKLRDYQVAAIDAVFNAWSSGMKAPAIVLPTGAGKTVVFSHLVKEFRSRHYEEPLQHKGLRVIILVHRDELADQALAKLRQVLPAGVSTGKVKATVREYDKDVMVCSVQTLARIERRIELMRGEDEHGKIGLIITDECHHAAAASYRKVFEVFSDALRLGVTATLERGDGVGLGDVWEDVVYTKSVLNMIANGYLVDVRAKAVDVQALDMAGVKRSGGDYAVGSLGQAVEDSGALEAVSRAYVEHAKDRQGIVFTPTVATAHGAAEELNRAGVKTAVVSAETPREERLRIYDDYRTGKLQVLSNAMVLTEGFDAPWAEVAVIARPTRSRSLYTQMVGRVLRTWPGKKEALVLDLVGASALGLRTLVDLTPGQVETVRPGETLAEAVVREAEEKNAKVPAGSLAFELRVRDVDMFAGSAHAWHRTRKGVMFIDIGKQKRIFLRPGEKQGWTVWGQNGVRVGSLGPQYANLELGMAMAWGEALAEEHAEFSTQRSASWRKGKPSPAQLNVAVNARIEGAGGMTRSQLSEALSVEFGSRSLDRFV